MAETPRAEVDVATGARRRPRIFYGWYVVAAAAGINVYGAGVWFYGFPIFYKVLLDEFGWSAAAGRRHYLPVQAGRWLGRAYRRLAGG
ncbi:MAG: hypothetical protein ABID84_05800 [Chloroflexota bacterium]